MGLQLINYWKYFQPFIDFKKQFWQFLKEETTSGVTLKKITRMRHTQGTGKATRLLQWKPHVIFLIMKSIAKANGKNLDGISTSLFFNAQSYTQLPLRYRIRRKRIESNFFLSINDKLCLLLSLIDRKKFDSILFFRILYLSVKWVLQG